MHDTLNSQITKHKERLKKAKSKDKLKTANEEAKNLYTAKSRD